jgi:hypothetical protein
VTSIIRAWEKGQRRKYYDRLAAQEWISLFLHEAVVQIRI